MKNIPGGDRSLVLAAQNSELLSCAAVDVHCPLHAPARAHMSRPQRCSKWHDPSASVVVVWYNHPLLQAGVIEAQSIVPPRCQYSAACAITASFSQRPYFTHSALLTIFHNAEDHVPHQSALLSASTASCSKQSCSNVPSAEKYALKMTLLALAECKAFTPGPSFLLSQMHVLRSPLLLTTRCSSVGSICTPETTQHLTPAVSPFSHHESSFAG